MKFTTLLTGFVLLVAAALAGCSSTSSTSSTQH